ncbi:hypothetical protein [Glycomyces sp. NPDC048151]|uniref:hypothetical protein n=1 Tax=Glycomyces sp. NPDC048151 TaxID=3364002 RepID=UPI003715CEF2
MRLDDREWKVRVGSVRLGAAAYRVIRPERPPAHGVLHHDFGMQFSVDKQATVDLAIAWWLAARSRRSIVWLPLRTGDADCGSAPGSRRLDLVLLHHSLAFRVSEWKRVRARIAESHVQKVTFPAGGLPPYRSGPHDVRWHHGFRDHLDWRVAADTLFIVGSRPAFEREGWKLRELAEEAPARLAEAPDGHCCAEIAMGRYRSRTYAELHVECCNRHW